MTAPTIQSMFDLTQYNNHGTAYIEGTRYLTKIAKAIGGVTLDRRMHVLKDCAKTFRAIEKECMSDGYLTHENSLTRRRAYDNMMTIAGNMLSEIDYREFYMCF